MKQKQQLSIWLLLSAGPDRMSAAWLVTPHSELTRSILALSSRSFLLASLVTWPNLCILI